MKVEQNFRIENRKDIMDTEILGEQLSRPEFLLKKDWVIQNIEFKLKMIDLDFLASYNRAAIQKIEHRVKEPESIARKLQKKGYKVTVENALTKLNDIIGIRVVCLYSDDVYKIAELLKQQSDFVLIKEKDYIKNPKKSGYQSLHLIMDIPLIYKSKKEQQRVEIQIRTVAMDFWAGVDNHICYKKSPEDIRRAEEDLKKYSDIISKIDRQMMQLRKKVEEYRPDYR